MDKRELISIRDRTDDPDAKRGLRWAIDQIETMERRFNRLELLGEVFLDQIKAARKES